LPFARPAICLTGAGVLRGGGVRRGSGVTGGVGVGLGVGRGDGDGEGGVWMTIFVATALSSVSDGDAGPCTRASRTSWNAIATATATIIRSR
jgi:hypothetical protein